MSVVPLAERIDALSRAVPLARGRFDDHDVDSVAATVAKARGRLRHGTDHTVVAFVGPTGAGKSSLFNAVCGGELSDVGVRRPTTSTTHACVWGRSGGELLDWLEIAHRHHREVDPGHPLAGLVLLDLPDFDSTTATNRIEVDRLVELVDLLVWINDPQKYADESVHRGYLTPLADHAPIMRFVVNKTDTLSATATDEILADLARRLTDDGIADADVVPVSVATGAGLDRIERLLADEVAAKVASVARLEADLRTSAAVLSSGGSATGGAGRGRSTLVERLGHAAGVDAVADLVAAQHRHDARRAVSWPPLRWFRRWGRQPIADVRRVGTNPVATAEIATALRAFGEDAADGLSRPWPAVVRRAARDRGDDLAHALGAATTTTARGQRHHPRWWTAAAAVQRLLTTVAVVGLTWLLALVVLGGFFGLDTDPLTIDTPGADWIPLPSALVIGALALSGVVMLLARVPAGVAARRHAHRTRRELRDRVGEIAEREVIEPIAGVLREHEELERLLAVARG